MADLEGRELPGRGQGAQRDRMEAQARGGLSERQEWSRHLLSSPALGTSVRVECSAS